MSAITPSNTIVGVNKALLAALKGYLDPDNKGGIDIRFDLPDVDSVQSTPTVSVFLYDVHEDLQLRQSERSRLNVSGGVLQAGWVNLSCNYLITYWEAQSAGSDGDGPDSSPDNQAVQIMTLTLQALLNNRSLDGIAGAYTRIVPPQENLSSLGSFWQALGNRPRLSLMYSVTVPILLDNSLPQTLVKAVTSEIVQTANVDMKALNNQLWQTLCQQLGSGGEQKLARVSIESQQQATEEDDGSVINVSLVITGIIDKAYQDDLEAIFKTWSDNKAAATEINGTEVHIVDLQKSELFAV
ncbi:uncharacterized protein DUF4255 [Enterobacter sp. BIGb0383]|uniref:DUF4255 domain-containing protein n=1 Tax=unclassified Enterobacter TaxID=2608935 RepID=UPI000F47C484|nr:MULTISPECIES: DUF4255 domain-containing protein [unclassified Enterobacter]ROP62286.1 uncharacterized protein DUF4255 [Enterobacter sp. BIGb0383]ROS12447.1 uncharacterized protein DUF4255 [Enterobacter sp. BIGb0359]